MSLDAVLTSTLAVTVGEIGDKTQLLALLLATRYKQPLAIVSGIVVATLLNHALASFAGAWLSHLIDHQTLNWIITLSFVLMGIWMLIPDKADDEGLKKSQWNAFWTTTLLFFVAEMGDKTQIATVLLAAHYQEAIWVMLGTTLGMLLADVPAVFFGAWIMQKVRLDWMRIIAAALFFLLAVLSYLKPISEMMPGS